MSNTRVGALHVAMIAISIAALSACAAEDAADFAPTLHLDELLTETTEFQTALINDGTVTSAEYEKALLAWRSCVEESGAVPSEIYRIGNEELTFDFEITAPDEESMQAIQTAADACHTDYFSEVGSVWAFQQLLTPAERAEVEPLVVACLQEAGIDLNDGADLDEIRVALNETDDSSSLALPCYEEFPGYFSVAPPDEGHEH